MTANTDRRWHADVEVTSLNVSLFRSSDGTALRLSEAIWVSGELNLNSAGRTLYFLSRKDRRLGKQRVTLRVAVRQSGPNWVSELSTRWFRCEVEIWLGGQRVLVRMSKAQGRQMVAAVKSLTSGSG